MTMLIRRYFLLFVICFAASCFVPRSYRPIMADGKQVTQATFNAFRVFYDYDKQIPLDARIREETDVPASENVPAYRRIALSFMNNHDERVPGLLWLPASSRAPAPCVLFLHGLGGNKMTGEPFALALLQQGYATLALDAAYHGERAAGKQPMYGTTFYRLRDGYIQTAVDYRRALDYIETRSDIDSRRITLIGVSMGGIMGSLLAAVESRIKCPVLLVAGADRGLMCRISEIEVWRRVRQENPNLDFDEISHIMAPADPLNFVGKISPRPLLMINGTKDNIVPVAANKLLHATAREPKRIIWLDSGHSLPREQTLPIIFDWLKKHL